jgi:hypothetical protein
MLSDSKNPQPNTGRPRTTGPGRPQVVRMHDDQLAAIDDWVEKQGTRISRPEAIRRLVEIGLKAKK